MAKEGFGCGRPECCSSTGICDNMTFGTGELDYYGYWEFPCKECEEAWRKRKQITIKYFLKTPWQEEATEVTEEQFMAAEIAAGFHSKFKNKPATSSFVAHGVSGWTEINK